ncbi:helicase loader [Gordonia phage Shivanishola]|nr:helicase loader [Gordonia phage Shivanishola]
MTSRETVEAAEKAWQTARFIDDRLGQPDPNRLRMWVDMFSRTNVHPDEAVESVKAWYAVGGRDRVIQPGDICAGVRDLRRAAIERDHAASLAAQPAVATDPQLGIPIAGADGEPIWPAYDVDDAGNYTCDTCHAEPDQACVNLATNMTRKIPCASRLLKARRAAKPNR